LHVDAFVFGGNRAFDHQDILAGVLGHAGAQRGFRLRARGRHQSLVVVEGDHVEDEVGDIGSRGTQERLGASGAVLEVQPDYRGPLRFTDRLRYLQSRFVAGERQSNRRGYHQHAT
jgi:hypothetical protein